MPQSRSSAVLAAERSTMAFAASSASPQFGTILRHFRRAASLSQEELAALAGLSTHAVGDLERGYRSRPRQETVTLLGGLCGSIRRTRFCLKPPRGVHAALGTLSAHLCTVTTASFPPSSGVPPNGPVVSSILPERRTRCSSSPENREWAKLGCSAKLGAVPSPGDGAYSRPGAGAAVTSNLMGRYLTSSYVRFAGRHPESGEQTCVGVPGWPASCPS